MTRDAVITGMGAPSKIVEHLQVASRDLSTFREFDAGLRKRSLRSFTRRRSRAGGTGRLAFEQLAGTSPQIETVAQQDAEEANVG